jgi:hypothetical protein
MVQNWGRQDVASVTGAGAAAAVSGAAVRLFRLNEFACVTLMGFGYLALHGYVLAAVGFVWYAALYVLRG